MSYRVQFSDRAERAFLSLPSSLRRRIGRRIDRLADDPRPRNAKPLHGPLKGLYSLRIGEYRALYRVEDDRLLILVLSVGPRGSVYLEAERLD